MIDSTQGPELFFGVVAPHTFEADRLGGMPALRIAQQGEDCPRGGLGVGDRHHLASRAELAILLAEALDQLATGADVAGHHRRTGRPGLQHHQRLRLADRGQDHHAQLRDDLAHLAETEKTHLVLQAETRHQAVAFGGVVGVFLFRADDPALGLRNDTDHATDGADEGLDVLDRHHAPDQPRHRRYALGTAGQRLVPAVEVDAVGNHPGTLGRRPIADLAQAVAFVQGDDRMRRAIGDQADAFEEADPQAADVADFRIQAGAQTLVRALGDPARLGQVDLALLGVDAVLAEQVVATPAAL